MVVNLIKSRQMFSLTLPRKIKGRYWLTDLDEKGRLRQLLSIEAVDGEWTVKSTKTVLLQNTDGQPVDRTVLSPTSFFNLSIAGSGERAILYAEAIDESRQTVKKIMVTAPDIFTIGKGPDNHFCFDNGYVSTHHARLTYDGREWAVSDEGSRNGTYVNGFRVDKKKLQPGDYIYIIGLKIVIGSDYIAVNNPDGKLKIHSESLALYRPAKAEASGSMPELPEKQYFFRSPRFHREIEHQEIQIDPPPQAQKLDTVPMALMLGPSLTMAMTSVSTGLLTVSNVLSNGGKMVQALPSLVMSVSMLLGTVLWPILTKRYEKKQRIKSEKERQEKYLAYLSEVGDQIREIGKRQEEILCENMISQKECADRILEQKSSLWERVWGQNDFLQLRLGLGEQPMDIHVAYQQKKFSMEDDTMQNAMLALAEEPKNLHQVPIGIRLTENTAVGVWGEPARTENLMKALVLQMVSLHSYDEVKIMLLADEAGAEHWNFARFIPHFWNDDRSVRFFAANADEVKELSSFIEKNLLARKEASGHADKEFSPYYVILCLSQKLGKKCDGLQQLLREESNLGATVIFAATQLRDLPKEAKSVIYANGEKSCIYNKDDTRGEQIPFSADTANESLLEELACRLANTELDLSSQSYALPSMITFLEMFQVGKVEHLNSLTRWKENNPTKTLQTPVGVDASGDTFYLDLHEKFHGPHGLVAGMTGSGKSEFIITYILSLAVNYHPDEVSFILIDYKGGGLAGAFEDKERGVKLPHLAGTITNLDGAAVKRSLISIQSELRRRQTIFNQARKISNEGTMDIYKYQQLYRDKVVTEPVPHLFIISDEFAELKTQQSEFMEQLISTARIGRSLGVHLILATQKPSGVVDDQIWSNSKFRVCLKVQDKSDSQDMIKRPDAAELSQTGRFYLQVGFNELFALGQSAWCGADYFPAENLEKNCDTSIQIVDNLGRVIMNAKAEKKGKRSEAECKQIVAIVKYLSDLAREEKADARPLWLDPIPPFIYVDDLEAKYGVSAGGVDLNPVVGEYDDPFNQKQDVLTLPFSTEGNCLIYGATGNGKTTLLTTLAYSLLKNHGAAELNLYILDFGAGTLKVFETAPQTGGVMLPADEEKTRNFFKMLQQEMEERRSLFSEFGGDYAGYCRSSGSILPNIVVLINNYSGFAEQYEDLLETFTILSRDGVKYGIYFAVTASGTGAVRYKVQQNFKQMMTMQLNDATDYSIIVGKTDGLIPSKYKGRGLVALDRVYEFQTAYCSLAEDVPEFLRSFCSDLAVSAQTFARPVPMLPETVTYAYVAPFITDLTAVPLGVNRLSLQIASANLSNKVIYPVVSQDLQEAAAFTEAFCQVLGDAAETVLADGEALSGREPLAAAEAENLVAELFEDMVNRNNTYKDARMNPAVLEAFPEKVYVFYGLKRLMAQLSADGRDKLVTLLEKAEAIYRIHFVMVESLSQFNTCQYDAWYKKHIAGTDGLWIGDGVTDQYMLKVGKLNSEMYEEIGNEFGYRIEKGRSTSVKLLTAGPEKEA